MSLREPTTQIYPHQDSVSFQNSRALQVVAPPLSRQPISPPLFRIENPLISTGLGLLIGVIAALVTSLLTGLNLY